MYHQWRWYRVNQPNLKGISCDLDNKDTISKSSLNAAMCKFITEIKKLDGSEYPGKTLYDIVICVQFHLEKMGLQWKLLVQEEFSDLKYTLDNLMKKRVSEGVGIQYQ